MTAQADLDEIVERITTRFSPDKIILFGSRARGDAKPDSDVDQRDPTGSGPPPKEQYHPVLAAGLCSRVTVSFP